jgi:hypothetical protein
MRINSEYFEDGILRIKCVASISPTIWSGNKETVIQQQGLQQFPDIPAPSIDTREALFLGKARKKRRKIVIVKHILIQSIFFFIRSEIERNYNQINDYTAKCKHFISQIPLSMKQLFYDLKRDGIKKFELNFFCSFS